MVKVETDTVVAAAATVAKKRAVAAERPAAPCGAVRAARRSVVASTQVAVGPVSAAQRGREAVVVGAPRSRAVAAAASDPASLRIRSSGG